MNHTFRLSEREPNLTLVKNCLAVTFINNDCKRCSDERQDNNQPQSFSDESSSQYNSLSNSESESCKCICGHLSPLDLFNSFVQENCDCFWNQSLVIGVSGLEYKGFIVPCTLLLTGSEYAFEVTRTAWARRVIKSPQGYTIVNLGDVSAIEMFQVFQTQFTPLSEALCKCVSDFNKQGVNAFISIIADHLKRQYPNIIPPSLDMLKKSLKVLQKEGKVKYSSKKGYIISRPVEAITSSPNSSILMTPEEIISQLYGSPALSTQSAYSCSAANSREMSTNVIASEKSFPINWDSDTNQSILKRSASLKIPKSHKAEDSESKFFTFTRSKSLRVVNKDKSKSFNRIESNGNHNGGHKKISIFGKLMMKFGSNGASKSKSTVLEVPKPIEDTRRSKSTQTLNRSNSNVTISRKVVKSNSSQKLIKNKCNTISLHKKLLNDYQLNCPYCEAIEFGHKMRHMNTSKSLDYCPICPPINLPPAVDPNCKACLDSFNFNCNNYNYIEPCFKSHLIDNENLPGRHHSAASALPSIMQPKIPLQLNNKEIERIEKYKPIAIQSAPISDEKLMNGLHSSSVEPDKETDVYSSFKKSAFNYGHTKNGSFVYSNQNRNKQSVNDEDDSDLLLKSKDLKVAQKGKFSNSVNVKIEIGSNKPEDSIKTCTSSIDKKLSSDDKFSSILDPKRCNYDDHKTYSNSGQLNPFKNSSLNTATTVTTNLINNVSSIDICAISRSEEKAPFINSIKPITSSLGISIQDYSSKKSCILNEQDESTLESRSSHDQSTHSTISTIRQKVAKAKAAFFNEPSSLIT